MHKSESILDSTKFLNENPILLDNEIMYTHYTHELMDSDLTRETVVRADLEPITLYD